MFARARASWSTTGCRASTGRSGRRADGDRRASRRDVRDMFTFHAAHDVLPDAVDAIAGTHGWRGLPGLRQRGHDPGRWRWLLPYMPRWFDGAATLRRLRRRRLVVARLRGGGAPAATRRSAPCYCYTPIRYVWATGRGRRAAYAALQAAACRRARAACAATTVAAARRRGPLHRDITAQSHSGSSEAYGRDAPVIASARGGRGLRARAAKDPDHFIWVHRLTTYKRPLRGRRGLRRPAPAADDGGRRAARGGASGGPCRPTSSFGVVTRASSRTSCGAPAGFVHVGEEDFGISMVEALAVRHPGDRTRSRWCPRHRPRRGERGLRVRHRPAENPRRSRAGTGPLLESSDAGRLRRAGSPRLNSSARCAPTSQVFADDLGGGRHPVAPGRTACSSASIAELATPTPRWSSPTTGCPRRRVDGAAARAVVLQLGANVGFGAAVNRVAATSQRRRTRRAQRRHQPEPGFLAALVDAARGGGDGSGVLLKAEQPAVIDTAGIVIDRYLGAYDHLQGQSVDSRSTGRSPRSDRAEERRRSAARRSTAPAATTPGSSRTSRTSTSRLRLRLAGARARWPQGLARRMSVRRRLGTRRSRRRSSWERAADASFASTGCCAPRPRQPGSWRPRP